MAALLTFLVVCSVAALVVAIYAANKPTYRLPDRYELDEAWYLPSENPTQCLWTLGAKLNHLRGQIEPTQLKKSDPSLADRLAALEAKGKKK